MAYFDYITVVEKYDLKFPVFCTHYFISTFSLRKTSDYLYSREASIKFF